MHVIVYDDDLIRYLSISLVNALIAADFHFKNAWPITEDKIREMLFEMHMSFYPVSPVLYIDRTSDFFCQVHSIISCVQLNETRVTSSHSVLIVGDRIHHIKCALANGHSL